MGKRKEEVKGEIKEKSLEDVWRDFVLNLMGLKEQWELVKAKIAAEGGLDLQSILMQEILARVSTESSFEIALSAMMNYWGSQGGLEVFLPGEKEVTNQEKEKEEE